MNNVWTENLAGQFSDPNGDDYHSHDLFGSEQYAGTKQFLGYNNVLEVTRDPSLLASSYLDPYQKAISIIHYTNSCISNFYGEMFNIDEDTGKLLNIDVPVMWHRRDGGGTGSGTTLGMTFVSDTTLKTVSDADASLPDVQYYDLIEFSGMLSTQMAEDPKKVGKVFPNLKIVVVDDEELIAAMSYKSNRNYTLPDLSATLVNCNDGPCAWVVKPGEKAYLTYWLDTTGGSGTTPVLSATTLQSILPQQRYIVLENKTQAQKDIQFKINNIDELPYMRKIESPTYDGYGFYANNFYLLSQVVDPDKNSRPVASQWKQTNFTSTNITEISGETINPILLENQNSNTNGFILTGTMYSGSTTFDLGAELDLPFGPLSYGKLTFGDERLFYGNLRTHIGATIYKSLFTINVDGGQIGSSTNTTFKNGTDRFITEIGILDNEQNLVIVGKLSRPIRIANSSTAAIELTLDF